MPPGLSALDLAVIAVYTVGTTLLGVWFARGQRDTRTYFVGDRNVSWWLVLVSIVATETSTVTFLSVPGVSYNPGDPSRDLPPGNFAFLQLAFGYVIGRLVIAWFLLPQYFRGEMFSAYQLLRERFSTPVQRVASGLFLMTRTLADGLRLFLTALLLEQFTGWNIYVSVLVMGAVTLLYTYLGGMQAVIWTDLIQFVIYILGAIIAGIVMLRLLPGGWDELVRTGDAAGKFRLFDFSANPKTTFTFWAGLIGGAFFTMASHGADQLMVQRYFCARNLSSARVALVASGLVVFAQFTLFLLLGVGLFALVNHGLLDLPDKVRNDQVFGIFIVSRMPEGVIGLVVAAVLAAAMSTLSSSLNSSATAFVSDFYRPLRPARSESHYLTFSKVMTSFWGAAQVGVAMLAARLNSNQSIVEQVLSIAGYTTGLILGLFLLGSLRRVVSSGSALVGLVAGAAVVLSLWAPELWGNKLLAFPWFAPIGAGTTVAVAWLVEWVRGRHGSPADRRA